MKKTVVTIMKFIQRRTAPAVFLLLALTGFIVYSDVLVNGIFMFDDYDYVLNSQIVKDSLLTNITDPRYIGHLTFKLNEFLGGKEDSFGYHLFNVITHVLNGILIYLLLVNLLTTISADGSGRDDTDWNKAVSTLASLLFVVHPLGTQSVSYITQRFTSLSTLFYLFAIWSYLAARTRLDRKTGKNVARVLYGFSVAATILAMKTKEITFTIPFMLLLFESLILKESRYGKKRFFFVAPFFATLVIIPLSIFGPDLGLTSAGEGVPEITRKDKIFDLTKRSTYEYTLTQLRVIVIYIQMLVLPADQAVIYDLKASRSFLDDGVIGSLALILFIMACGFWSWLKGFYADGAKSRCYKLIALGIAWFFITLSIESSIIPIKDLIFEHRTYLPSVGFFAAVSALFLWIAKNLWPGTKFVVKFIILATALSVPLGVAAYMRNAIWTDEVLFWEDAVEKAPNKPISYHNRAFAYVKRGYHEKALKDFDKAISYFSGNIYANTEWDRGDLSAYNMSKAYANRASLLMSMGYGDLAQEDMRRSKDVFFVSAIPDSAPVTDRILSKKIQGTRPEAASDGMNELHNRGELLMQQGQHRQAIEIFNRIIETSPGNVTALINRGNALTALKEYEKAIADFNKAVGLSPDFATAYHNRGLAYAWSGNKTNALRDMNRACGLGFKASCDMLLPILKDSVSFK